MSRDERSVAQLVRDARVLDGLTKTELAALADVSVSTISRIESGKLDPTFTVFRRIMEGAGYTVKGPTESVADEDASVAAVCAFRGTKAPGNAWLRRWTKAGLVDAETGLAKDIAKLGFIAGRANRLADRRGVVRLPRPASLGAAIKKLRGAGIRFVVTGTPALGDSSPSFPAIYVSDPQAAAKELSSISMPGTSVPISLIPLPAGLETVRAGSAEYTTPERALVDLYSGGGRDPELADEFARVIAEAR